MQRRRHAVTACRACPNLEPEPAQTMNMAVRPIHYCWGFMMWRGPEERVHPCPYRARGYIQHELRDRGKKIGI